MGDVEVQNDWVKPKKTWDSRWLRARTGTRLWRSRRSDRSEVGAVVRDQQGNAKLPGRCVRAIWIIDSGLQREAVSCKSTAILSAVGCNGLSRVCGV